MKRIHAIHWIWLLTGLFCLLLVTDSFATLRGDAPWMPKDGKWIWPYSQPRWAWVVPCVLGLTLYLAGTAALLRRSKTIRPLGPILWTFLGAALLPLLLLTLEGEPLFLLFTRSASHVTGGYQYALALSGNMDVTLQDWPGFVRSYRTETANWGGVSLSPPGLVVVYYGVERFFDAFPLLGDLFGGIVRPLECQNLFMMDWTNTELASAWFQMFVPLWAALGVAPLYKLAKMLYDRNRARLAVVLWPLIPGMAIFTPRFNVFYAMMTVVMLLILWRGLLANRPILVALSGFIVSMAIFFNLSVVPLGLLGGLIILGHRLIPRPASLRPTIRDLIAFGIGSTSVWLVYWLLTGETPITIIRTGMKYHYQLNRPYFPWLFMHTYDTFLFVGLPLTFLALWRVGRLRRVIGQPFTPGDIMTAAIALTMIIMVLSGTARGETGRVWLFFVPVWILLGADLLAEWKQRERLSFLAAQALCMLCLAAVLRANFTELTMPPSPAKAAGSPTFPYDVRFKRGDDRVTLAGVSIESAPRQVTLHLYWEADTWVQRPYVLSLVVVAPDGTDRPSINWNPEGWDYPPSCWKPGHTFVDTVQIPVDQPGAWLFSLSISDTYTKEFMIATGLDGQSATQIGIGPVSVPGSKKRVFTAESRSKKVVQVPGNESAL